MKNFPTNVFYILKKLSRNEKLIIFLLVFSSLYLVALEALTFSTIYTIFSNDFDNVNNFFIENIFFYLQDYFKKKNDLLIFFLVFCLFIRNISHLLFQFLTDKFIYNLYAKSSKMLLESYFKKDLFNFFKKNKAEYLKSIIKESYLVYLGVVYACITLAADFIYLFSLCIFAIYFLNIDLNISYLGLFLFCFVFYFLLIKKIKNLGKVRENSETGIYKFCTEILSSIVEIRIYKKSNLLIKSFFSKMLAYCKSMVFIHALNILPKNFLEILLAIIILFLYFNSNNQNDFFLNNAYFASIGFVIYRIVPSISNIFIRFNTIIVNYPAIDIFKKLYEEKARENISQDVAKFEFKKIILDNVNFSINHKKIITDFSYTFHKGNIYCLKGSSGSGKTCLIYLLLSLYKFNSGNFFIDGIEIKNEISWGNSIGFVSQTPIILDLELSDNLFIDDMNELSSTDKNYFYEFGIGQLIDKTDELNKDGLRNLSGGEKQRLSIIKALIRKPKLLILDEPFSALDKKNTLILIEQLKKIRKETIIILSTHENSLDEHFDKIITLN
jgi:ABC-type multidrug transport system fused ATPase/permease subunit